MNFFFPDSQDQINPSFDFVTEEHSIFRVRQRDDRYAHEVLDTVPFDGILVSKAIVDGTVTAAGKYTASQRARFLREGVRRFFRLDDRDPGSLQTMGDCGAFAYVREDLPPYTVDGVIDFYEEAGFDFGISVDHIVLGFTLDTNETLPGVVAEPSEWERRRLLTLGLATEFMNRHQARRCSFAPVGVAQGWSPASYADSVLRLQNIGYERIALGGMVSLKTPEILRALDTIQAVRDTSTRLHLLGVTRVAHLEAFAGSGVTSFDSTSPFRQAFKDETDNYYLLDGALTAVRVPQVDGNAKLKARIQAGLVRQTDATELEQRCLNALRSYAARDADLDDLLDVLRHYEAMWNGRQDRSALYRETLQARPWESCGCGICSTVGIEVVIFRGSERNKRRGFHNLFVFGQRLERQAAQNGQPRTDLVYAEAGGNLE